MKSSVYRHAAVLACSLAVLGLLVGCLEMKVAFEATNPDTTSPATSETSSFAKNQPSAVSQETVSAANVSNSTSNQTHQIKDSESKNTALVTYNQQSAKNAQAWGTLRMINQTNQPVRLALLARQSAVKGSTTIQNSHNIPAHWDFAPKEGSERGLLLSLPNGNLKLEKGDILVAFAQDGSRRYWGPYVVGETSLPRWNSPNKEWQLVLDQ
ncbi:hypothetical protein [Fortiea contorta]|uniref:hypothetical protein n=1 Tax=Fortiea contorta TaxID=1892405 RepID=UPI000476BE26|nr:hypothetical protein [Fortiea contorta]